MGLLSALGLAPGVRVNLPDGGSVEIPAPYEVFPPGDHRHRGVDAIAAYRRWHSTMAGTNESNGMIAVGHPHRFTDLKDFVSTLRGVLTTRWNYANESESRWYGNPHTFPETPAEGPNGPERVGKLKIHVVGWTVHDKPGCLYAVNDKRGVMIAVWIYDRDGGEKRARRYAERIAASFRP